MEVDQTKSSEVYVCFPKLNAIWTVVFVNNKDPDVKIVKDRTGDFVMSYPNFELASKVAEECMDILEQLNIAADHYIKVSENIIDFDNCKFSMLYLTAVEIINDLNRDYGYGKFSPSDSVTRLPIPSMRKGGKLMLNGEFKIAHLEALVVLSKVHLHQLEDLMKPKGKVP